MAFRSSSTEELMTMKNSNTILALLLFALVSPASAQVLIDENFSGGLPGGWSNTTVVGEMAFDTWRFNNPGNRATNLPISAPFAIFDSDNYSGGGGAEDVVLESVAIAVPMAGVVLFEWDEYFRTGFGGGGCVDVFDGSVWQTVHDATTTGSGAVSGPAVSHAIDITSHVAGLANARIRFRWTGSFSWFWIIDNVKVTAAELDYPGSAGDLELLSGVGTNPAMTGGATGDIETATAGDIFQIHFSSPDGTYHYEPPYVAASFFMTGSPPAGHPSFNDIHLDINNSVVLVRGTEPTVLGPAVVILPGGNGHAWIMPPGIAGFSILFQVVVRDSSVTSTLVLSDGHEVRMM